VNNNARSFEKLQSHDACGDLCAGFSRRRKAV
jgi:hypothetical protein